MRVNSIWRTLVVSSSLAIVAIIAPSSSANAEKRMLCVHGLEAPQALNVRSGPGYDASVVGRFPAKACGVKLVGRCATGWCVMALGNQTGWVNTRYIAVYDVPDAHKAAGPPPPIQAFSGSERRVVEQGSRNPGSCVARVDRGDTLRIRTGPGVSNDEIGGIPPGVCGVARTGGCRGAWCRIAWRGREGWVNAYFLD